MGLTADLVIVPPKGSRKPILVIDHKTGQEDFSEPLKKPQLLSLARAALVANIGHGRGVIAGVLAARRRGMATVYADVVPRALLDEHTGKVFRAVSRIGDGYMRPGPWCLTERCPAANQCPARDADLLSKAGGLLVSLAEAAQTDTARVDLATLPPAPACSRGKKLGNLYAIVRQAERLADASRRELRNEVLAGALPEMPDGGYLIVRKYPRENLSKASVLRAYGKLAGEKLLTKLRRDGAVEVTEVSALHVEGEKGGRT
jgi:hypothetical protein